MKTLAEMCLLALFLLAFVGFYCSIDPPISGELRLRLAEMQAITVLQSWNASQAKFFQLHRRYGTLGEIQSFEEASGNTSQRTELPRNFELKASVTDNDYVISADPVGISQGHAVYITANGAVKTHAIGSPISPSDPAAKWIPRPQVGGR